MGIGKASLTEYNFSLAQKKVIPIDAIALTRKIVTNFFLKC